MSNGFKLFIACVFISTGVLILNFVPGANAIPDLIDFIVTPMQELSNELTNAAVSVVPQSQKSAEEYEQEIQNLKAEVKRMRTILVDYYDVKRENAQYLKFYDFKKQNESLIFKMASVISRDPNDLFFGFTLDKGSNDGISINDPVITENGLIGRVSSVKSNSCKVKTILSPEYKIGVIDKVTYDSGVVTGKKSLANENKTAMMYISAQNKMQVDDIVVTTGLGGICPKDLPVGKIKEIKNDDYDSSFYAVVEPFDDIKEVIDVFVVTGFRGKGDIGSGTLPEAK
jgi:rod shape-determining protein MreC